MRRLNLTLLVLLLTQCGCGMPRTLVWLPDSSGFIFPTDGRGIAHFDLASGQQRLILRDSRSMTVVPAVNPGKMLSNGRMPQFLLVRVTAHRGFDEVRLQQYDMLGRQVPWFPRQSGRTEPPRRFRLAAANPEIRDPQLLPSAAIWPPEGNHLLVWYRRTNGDLRIAKYDFMNDQFKPLEDTIPLVDLWYFGVSPVADIVDGYLATSNANRDFSHLYFVRWDGWRKNLKTPSLEDFDAATENPLPTPVPPFSGRLPAATGGWFAGVLDVVMGDGYVSIDPLELRQATHVYDKQLTQLRNNQITFRQSDDLKAERIVAWMPLGDSHTVQARLVTSDDERLMQRNFKPHIQLEVKRLNELASQVDRQNKVESWTRVIGRAILPSEAGFSPVMPSPDKKLVAITYAGPGGTVRTAVVDDSGETVADIEISGRGG